MVRGRIRLLATIALTTLACGGHTEELGSSPLDAAVARWSRSEVRRLEARLPTVDARGQARAGCVAFARQGGSDDPFFEVDMKRPADPATDPPDALESIVTSYAALEE